MSEYTNLPAEYPRLEGDKHWVTLKPNQDWSLYIETRDEDPDVQLRWHNASPPIGSDVHDCDYFIQLYVGDLEGHAVFRQAWQDITRLRDDVFRFGTVQHGEPVFCHLNFAQCVSLLLPVVPRGAVAYSTHLGLAEYEKHAQYLARILQQFGLYHKVGEILTDDEWQFLVSPPICAGDKLGTQYQADPQLLHNLRKAFMLHYRHLVTIDTFMRHPHRHPLQQAILTNLTQHRPSANRHVRRDGTKIIRSGQLMAPARPGIIKGLTGIIKGLMKRIAAKP